MWQAQVLSNFLLTSVWSVSDEGIIDAITATTSSDMLEVYIPFHLPSNMFWTTYIQVGTSLTTNSWSNEDGRSNILYKGQIKNSG